MTLDNVEQVHIAMAHPGDVFDWYADGSSGTKNLLLSCVKIERGYRILYVSSRQYIVDTVVFKHSQLYRVCSSV